MNVALHLATEMRLALMVLVDTIASVYLATAIGTIHANKVNEMDVF